MVTILSKNPYIREDTRSNSQHRKTAVYEPRVQIGFSPAQTKWSLHQIQGGAMNAAHAHVCASLLYKAKLCSNRPFVCHFTQILSQRESATNFQFVYLKSPWAESDPI